MYNETISIFLTTSKYHSPLGSSNELDIYLGTVAQRSGSVKRSVRLQLLGRRLPATVMAP